MSNKIEVKSVQEQPALTIRTTAKPQDLGPVMGQIIPKVWQFTQQKGIELSGPPFALYHSFSEDAVDFECGVPVKIQAEGEGDIQASTIPGGEAAATMHIGPYDKLGETYGILENWMKAQGYRTDQVCWEIYWTDPREVANPAEWQTEVFWLVK